MSDTPTIPHEASDLAVGDRATASPVLRFIAPVIGLAFFVVQIPFARFAYDSHHDGFMVVAAIAVRDGNIIHRDVFTLYGPLTPLLHASWLIAPIGPVLALRLGTCLLNALTAAFVADLGRVAPRAWGVSMTASVSASILWIVLNDVWRGNGIVTYAYATLPWPSVVSATLFAFVVWVLARGNERPRHIGTYVVAGTAVGASVFVKLNIGVFAVATTITTAFAVWTTFPELRRQTVSFLGGILLGFSLPLSYLAASGAGREYVEQSLLTPRALAESMAADWDPLSWLTRTLLVNTALGIALMALALVWKRARLVTVVKVVFALVPLLILWLWANRVTVPYSVGDHLGDVIRGITWQDPRTWENFRFVHLIAVLSLLFAFGTYVSHLTRVIRRPSARFPNFGLMISCCLAAACLAQIYPAWDVRHFWWGIPIILIFAFRGIETVSGSTGLTRLVTVSMLLIILPMTMFLGARTLAEVRVPHRSGPLLEGMLGEPEEVDFYEARYNFVVPRTFGPSRALFIANDGDLSVLTGKYRALDPDWGVANIFTPSLSERTSTRPTVISDLGVDELMERVGGTDYFIASRAANLTHLLAPPCIAGNCPGVEPNDVCMSWGSCRPRSTPEPLELVPDSSFTPVTPWSDWNVNVNTGFSYPEDDGAWITGHHARLTFDNVPTDTVRVSLYPFLPPEWTHIDISILTDSEATPIRLNVGVTNIDLPVKANTWNELVFRCDTLHRPSELGLGEDQRPLCAKVLGFEPIP